MYQMIAELKAGSVMPPHQHPQEQIIHILSGRMKVNAGNDSRVLGPGDSYYLASNVSHGVETLGAAVGRSRHMYRTASEVYPYVCARDDEYFRRYRDTWIRRRARGAPVPDVQR